jgi:creatinine amidohydrolase
MPGAEEYETLVRVVGPMTGYVAALRLARSLAPRGGELDFAPERIAEAVAAVPAGLAREHLELAPETFDGNVAFVAQGAYVECVDNRSTIQENFSGSGRLCKNIHFSQCG